jgi:hypothetical protein
LNVARGFLRRGLSQLLAFTRQGLFSPKGNASSDCARNDIALSIRWSDPQAKFAEDQTSPF